MDIEMSQATFDRLSARLEREQGVTLTGTSGTLEKMGVKASYRFSGDTLHVEIVEKPFLVAEQFLERKLREWLA